MFYINLNNRKKINIPQELLVLFELHEADIAQQHIDEVSSQYILENSNISEETFSEMLFALIEEYNIDEVSLYKKSNIDRRLFSKIRSNTNYHPSFGTVTLLSLALRLPTSVYEKLLNSASYALPQNSYVNIILKYCFDNQIYDSSKVDDLLYSVCKKQIREL